MLFELNVIWLLLLFWRGKNQKREEQYEKAFNWNVRVFFLFDSYLKFQKWLPSEVVQLWVGHVRYRCAMHYEALANYEIRKLEVVRMDSIRSSLKLMVPVRVQPTIVDTHWHEFISFFLNKNIWSVSNKPLRRLRACTLVGSCKSFAG